MGVQCVSVCAYALRISREHLKQSGCEVGFRPRWRKIEAGSGTTEVRSAVQLDVHFFPTGDKGNFMPPCDEAVQVVAASRASTPPPPTVDIDTDEEEVLTTRQIPHGIEDVRMV
eukprot:Hpha_TRINITY_DN10273_c0_g1::TRINITY_DN10273_c0_g1_i2::g.34995::m.34995